MDRMVRVNELIKRELGETIERLVSRDHPGALITVGQVDTQQDLRHAHVHISIYGADDDTRHAIMARLHAERAEIQRRVFRRVRLKYTPKLHFVLGDALAEGDRVLDLLETLDPSPADETPPTRDQD